MNRHGEALRSNGIWLLALGFLMVALAVPTSHAQDITTDPFVQQELDRSNWEPGGTRFPGTFFARGPIVLRGGTVVVSPLPEQQIGGFVLQQGVVLGQYTYTIDLAAPHGFTVHSPFDLTTTASDSASLKTPTQEIDVFLSWDGQLHHPADGYDPPTGGGFPPATGARDEFTFDITGNVSGLFFAATSNGSAFAATQAGFVPTASSSFSLNGTVSGGQVNGGFQQASVTQQSIDRQGSINPNGAYQLNAARYGVSVTTPQTTQLGGFFRPITSLSQAYFPFPVTSFETANTTPATNDIDINISKILSSTGIVAGRLYDNAKQRHQRGLEYLGADRQLKETVEGILYKLEFEGGGITAGLVVSPAGSVVGAALSLKAAEIILAWQSVLESINEFEEGNLYMGTVKAIKLGSSIFLDITKGIHLSPVSPSDVLTIVAAMMTSYLYGFTVG